jgi:pyruvate dehydrogenase E1 component
MSEAPSGSPADAEAIARALAEDKQEWAESIEAIYAEFGESGVREILRSVQDHALGLNVPLNEATLNTPYVNTISLNDQPGYPGDVDIEERIERINRWNAIAMVLQAQDQGTGVGGHIATYASCATMLEVGFNHFFRGRDGDVEPDMVLPQPHAAPGIYARAYLEGRFDEARLRNYRRELAEGGGLASYPHPRSMPDFWEMPNASMGLSTPAAIYQARFAKYLENRGLKTKSNAKIWCFIGDGESDEPEVLGTINIAARENLDNLILVVNCNLQRLDGPVRGNGKIIQELERVFRGADWNVIKVIWGSGWDGLLARDKNGVLRKRMDDCLDGDYQMYSVLPGDVQREHWVEGNPELERMMSSLTDEEVRAIKRGGQDQKKVYAAFDQAIQSTGKPTVLLIKTVKGDGMGAQGKNTAHQYKNMPAEERVKLARELEIPIGDEAARAAEFYRPPEDSPEVQYLLDHRRALGGPVPRRVVECPSLPTPPLEAFQEFLGGSEREVSTTMAMVRLLAHLLRLPEIGPYVVPIVPDEARTFGMDGLFKVSGIYAPEGQKYRPVDADTLMPYREAADGQILQEGICETGAMASFMAAGSAYAVHGVPTIPFYIFYSMFGFQRVGDMIWSCGDMMCRGFLLGGTAGRTTLNGEGLQHEDGHSHLIASTVPNLLTYDPAFGYEVALIVRDGIRRMYELQEDVFYYLTLYNENYAQPNIDEVAERTGATVEQVTVGILKGGYCFDRTVVTAEAPTVNLLASGSIVQQILGARDRLVGLGINVNVYSITSFVELERDAQDCQRANRLHPLEVPKAPYVETLFREESGVFVAVSDYMKKLAAGIAQWLPGRFEALGTDGYGLSESRPSLRAHFEVDDRHITQAALAALYRDGAIDGQKMEGWLGELDIAVDKPNPRVR